MRGSWEEETKGDGWINEWTDGGVGGEQDRRSVGKC